MSHIAKEEIENKEIEESVKETHEKKEEDSAELRDKLLRLAAEFDNYKKRVKKDLDNAETMGKASLIRDMLPVIDEFELAMLALDGAKDSNLAKGIELLYSNFMDTLKKEGLEEVEADDIADPYKHETVMVRESDEKEGTIVEVVKKGYMFGDKLIRPASVIISKGKESKENKNDEKKE